MKRSIVWLVGMGLVVGLWSGAGYTQDAIGQAEKLVQQGNTQGAMTEMLKVLKSQQQQIDSLLQKTKQQDEVIGQQQTTIQQQSAALEQQNKKLAEAPAAGGPSNDSYAAQVKYELAYDIQHTAIFDVRPKDAKPYFEKAAERFREVVDQYPKTMVADDAQFHLATIYQRYLKDRGRAIQEFQKLIQNYPDSQYIGDSKKALATLGAGQ